MERIIRLNAVLAMNSNGFLANMEKIPYLIPKPNKVRSIVYLIERSTFPKFFRSEKEPGVYKQQWE